MAITKKTYSNDVQAAIFERLENNTNFTNSFLQVSAIFPMSQRTFSRYWKEAKIKYDEFIQTLYNEAISKKKKEAIKRIKETPVTKYRVIQACMLIVEKGKDRDRINALRLICDIEGYKAPIKQDVTLHAVTPAFGFNPLIDNVIDVTEGNK